MKTMLKGFLCLALAVSSLAAQNTQDKKASPAGLPPLIDRELIFGNPEISGAQLSPDGKYLAFQKPWKDTRNIYVKAVDEPFSAARLLTAEPKRPIAGYFWSRDSKYILFAKDNDGDENYNVYAVDPGAKPAAGADAPAARDLTGLKGVRVELVDIPKSDPDTIYIGLNDRDKAWHDLYKLKVSTGEKTLVRKNTERIVGWDFDLQGNLRLASRSAESGDTEILRVDSDKFTKIYSCKRVRVLQHNPLPEGRQAGVHRNEQGRRHGPEHPGAVRSGKRKNGDGGIRSAQKGGFRHGCLL